MTPDVSIVVPVHNDEEFIAVALESCRLQTWENIEIICVDDASTDATVQVIEGFQRDDHRIALLRQERNRSAFQARRVGIHAARAPFVMFLDGDDELMPNAVETALILARSGEADVVGFGVEVVSPDGQTGGRFERTLQPAHHALAGHEILTTLFPTGKTAQGHIWKYLWRTDLLREAYAGLSADLELYRANDIPIAFLALASATRYVSTQDKLLRYYWRRGTSGHSVQDRETFEFYLSGLTSIDTIGPKVEALSAQRSAESAAVLDAVYESARLSIIGNLLRYWAAIVSDELREDALTLLGDKAGLVDVVRAAATFSEGALPQLTRHRHVFGAPVRKPVRSILLTATNLDYGGAQGVVVSQAKHLLEAGFRVVIGVRTEPVSVYELPSEVELVRIWGATQAERISRYLTVCREYEVDVAIDHWTLYREDWPFVALAAATIGVRTVGWIHNFALRPIFDGNRRISFLTSYLPLLWKVVTLSETDAAFWKLRGIAQPVYLPNPPSPFLLDRPVRETARALGDGPIRLVWWGRLQQSTKRVRDLIGLAKELRALDVSFHLTIIGPDSPDLTAAALVSLATEHGVEDAVSLPGPMNGTALHDALEKQDLYIGTSAIEGYPLTLVEAQSLGLPLAMYELPWLATLQGNDGVLSVPQFDLNGLAQKIADLSRDRQRYSELSEASLRAARAVLAHDFTQLYAQLLTDALPPEHSPAPTVDHAHILIDRSVAYAEQNIRWARRTEDRLRARIRELMESNAGLQRAVGDLTAHDERMTELARVRGSKNAGLSRLRRQDQAKIEQLRAKLAALKTIDEQGG